MTLVPGAEAMFGRSLAHSIGTGGFRLRSNARARVRTCASSAAAGGTAPVVSTRCPHVLIAPATLQCYLLRKFVLRAIPLPQEVFST